MQKTISILRAPMDLGAGVRGAGLGAEAIMKARLRSQLSGLPLEIEDAGTLDVPAGVYRTATSRLKYLEHVRDFNIRLSKKISELISRKRFPLVLGGDHSISIGTIAGVSQHYDNLGVLWVDAHGDLNTAETSPTGNIHGMSLAVSLGKGDSTLTSIGNAQTKVKPANVVIVGARDLDEGERKWIQEAGINCFTMHDIDRLGMATIMEKAFEKIAANTDGVHLSFDIDSVDPSEAPGTGTPVKGGLSYREAHFVMEFLYQTDRLTSAEVVEVNPEIDKGNQTSQLAVGLIGSLFGKRIL